MEGIRVPRWLGDQKAGTFKKKPKKLPRFLTIKEIQAMVNVAERVYPDRPDAIQDGRNTLIIGLFFYTGMRCNELRTLQIDQIDWANKFIKVMGKGKRERLIPVPNFVLVRLAHYIGNRKKGAVFSGKGRDRMMSRQHFWRLVRLTAREGKIRNWKEVHPHTLRHSYATYLRNKGFDLDKIQVLLGHKNLETTRIYSHLGLDQLFEEVHNLFKG